MALIKPAAILDDIINSIGKVTFWHTRSGLSGKEKSKPGSVNPFTPSPSQINRRAEFRIPCMRWKTLTLEQIKAWCDLASTIKKTSKIGESYLSDGYHLYVELNHNRQIIGLSVYDEAPVIPDVIGIRSFTVSTSNIMTSEVIIELSTEGTNAATIHEIYATPGMNMGRSYVRNQYRYIGQIPPSTYTSYNCSAGYLAEFGQQQGKKKLYFKLVPIDWATGFAGTPIINSGVTPVEYNELNFSQLDYNFVLAP
jgi:hypothetical protein